MGAVVMLRSNYDESEGFNFPLLSIGIAPKSAKLVAIWKEQAPYILKYYMTELYGPLLGDGYIEFEDSNDSWEASETTGMPRIHVAVKNEYVGSGLGTAVYTGGCTMSAMINARLLKIGKRTVINPGVCSPQRKRSALAERWWTRAKNVWGLAYSVEKADAYPFKNAVENNLVAANAITGDLTTHELASFGRAPITSVGFQEFLDSVKLTGNELVLASANFGWFQGRGEAGEQVMQLLLAFAEKNFSDQGLVEQMRLRYSAGMDIEPMQANPVTSRARIRFYGRRPNPAVSKRLQDAADLLAAQRKALGWNRFDL